MLHTLTRAGRLACAVVATASLYVACTAVNAQATVAPGRFGTGWTNVVPTGRAHATASFGGEEGTYMVHDAVFYDSSSGRLSTGHFDSGGNFYNMANGAVPAGYTTVVGTPNYRRDPNNSAGYVSDQMFYQPSTGLAFFAYMTERGTSLRYCGSPGTTPGYFTAGAGWTSIVPWRTWGGFGGPTNMLLLYNKQTGEVDSESWGGCTWGSYFTRTWISAGYTSVTVTRNNQVFFYNSSNGEGLTAHFAGSIGGVPTLQRDRYYGLPTGYTQIVGDDDGNLLFFGCPVPPLVSNDGLCAAASGVLNSDGTFATTASYRFGHWSSVVAWPSSPHILFSYNKLTGQANTGYLNSATRSYVSLVDWL
jgi:hypothetical protein